MEAMYTRESMFMCLSLLVGKSLSEITCSTKEDNICLKSSHNNKDIFVLIKTGGQDIFFKFLKKEGECNFLNFLEKHYDYNNDNKIVGIDFMFKDKSKKLSHILEALGYTYGKNDDGDELEFSFAHKYSPENKVFKSKNIAEFSLLENEKMSISINSLSSKSNYYYDAVKRHPVNN